MHGAKLRSAVTQNGLIAMLDGPCKGKRHDSSMLAKLNNHSTWWTSLYICGLSFSPEKTFGGHEPSQIISILNVKLV